MAGQAGDDHVEDGDDAVQDGTEDGADGVDDAHQAGTDSVEDAGDLEEMGMLELKLGLGRVRGGKSGVTYAGDDGTHFVEVITSRVLCRV